MENPESNRCGECRFFTPENVEGEVSVPIEVYVGRGFCFNPVVVEDKEYFVTKSFFNPLQALVSNGKSSLAIRMLNEKRCCYTRREI